MKHLLLEQSHFNVICCHGYCMHVCTTDVSMLVKRKFIQLSSVLLMFALVVVYFLSVLTSRRDSFEYNPREVSIGSPDEKKVITMAVDYGAHEVVLQSSSLSTNGEGVGRRLSDGLHNKMNLRHLQPTHDAGVVMATVDYSTRQVTLEPSQLSPLSTQSKVEGEVPDALHNVNHIQSDPAHDKQSSGRESRLVVRNEDSTLQSAAQTTQLLPNSVHNEVQPTQSTGAVDMWNVKYLSLVQKKGGVLQSTVQKTQLLSAPVQKELPSSTTNDAWRPHKTRRLHLSDYTSTRPTPPTTTAMATLLTTSLKASDSPRVQQSSFCFGKFCVNAVESSDRQRMFDCLRKALEYVRSLGYSHRYALNKMQCSCKLMNGAGRKRFGLVSLPGSGNTWVRGLLEKATGVCTGSMWCDRTLRSAYFCGEGMRGKSLLLVKNHDASIHWNGENSGGERQSRKVPYDAVIFLHRNPFDAIVAEWNRAAFDKYQNASTGSNMHTARYGPDMFGEGGVVFCVHSIRTYVLWNHSVALGSHRAEPGNEHVCSLKGSERREIRESTDC